MPATFLLSAFGDEIDDDLTTQIDVLDSEGITALELRSTWGVNVLDLSGDRLRRVRELLHERGFLGLCNWQPYREIVALRASHL